MALIHKLQIKKCRIKSVIGNVLLILSLWKEWNVNGRFQFPTAGCFLNMRKALR